jgi:predicted AAA+ superfamily ATPase
MAKPATTASNNKYLPRVADAILANYLKTSGAVQVKGPKWCGKTATAERQSASQVYLQDPDNSAALLALADIKPSALLEGAEPRLIDEWQMAPQLWDAVRFAIDRGHGRGRFILTGSATPKKRPVHSGVGRIARFTMSTMSLFESGESIGGVSIRALFDGKRDIAGIVDSSIEDIAFATCRGGWPEAVTEKDRKIALLMAKNYVDELLDSDIEEMDGIKRNATWMRSIMRSYARNISTEAAFTTIAADMQGEQPSDATIADYLDALSRACVTDDLVAWNPRLRSKTAVRTSPTRHFCDPSIAAALLHVSPENLLEDLNTFGLLFESVCVRDLRVYTEALGGAVFHYRDKTGLEADAVICLNDGRWAPVEVKMGASQIDIAAKNLKKLADRVDVDKEGKPSFLLVLTATTAAYQREDGVIVAPITMLEP